MFRAYLVGSIKYYVVFNLYLVAQANGGVNSVGQTVNDDDYIYFCGNKQFCVHHFELVKNILVYLYILKDLSWLI